MNEETCCSDFWPTFETCPECNGQQYIFNPSDRLRSDTLTVERCTYCYKGKIAVYYSYRSWWSRILCCHPKFTEPDNAKARLIGKQLEDFSCS